MGHRGAPDLLSGSAADVRLVGAFAGFTPSATPTGRAVRRLDGSHGPAATLRLYGVGLDFLLEISVFERLKHGQLDLFGPRNTKRGLCSTSEPPLHVRHFAAVELLHARQCYPSARSGLL